MNELEFCEEYLRILKHDLAGLNLTRILEPQEFHEKQYIDSIIPWEKSDIFKTEILKTGMHVDVGFGGGFPLLPISFLGEGNFNSIGLESRRKKVDAVNLIAEKLNLTARAYHHRLENVFIDKHCLISFKAVGPINDLLSKINTNKDILAFFYKGPSVYELETPYQPLKGWELIEEKKLELGENTRVLLSYRNVPRGTKSKNKLKVKISELH